MSASIDLSVLLCGYDGCKPYILHFKFAFPGAPVGVITATVSQLSKPLVLDDTGDDTDLKTGSDSATPLFVQTWRHHPHVNAPREILIIGSFGDCVNLEQQQLVRCIIKYILLFVF